MTLVLGAFVKVAKRHPAATLAGITLAAVTVRICCLPVLPRPVALIPDEHSHLLLARTLSAGRISNPPHPMWHHFETLFVLQRPTYASVYPPVQGTILALGWLLFGEPWAGVLASMAGMCAAIVWMLRAYVTRIWALYGGLLAGAGHGVLSYWVNSYWGGAGAAIGGALVFGALPRMLSKLRRRDAAALGAGLFLLANSRPFEGFLVAVPVAYRLASRFGRRGPQWRLHAPALGAVILAGAAFTCWYNWRVTGNPFRLPYNEYIRQYAAAPAFVWQGPLKAPEYTDPVLRDAHISFGIDYAEYSTLAGAARRSYRKLARITTFYLGPFWPLALLALPEFVRIRRHRLVASSLALCVVGILLTVGFQVHYAAPCTSVFVLLLVDTFRRVRRLWRNAGAIFLIAAPPLWIGALVMGRSGPAPANSLTQRPAAQERLAAESGRHVVLVHYGPSHPLGQEWVYNEPDIDRGQVIWARDLGRERNRRLMAYYPERTFWLVEPDQAVPRLSRCMADCVVSAGANPR